MTWQSGNKCFTNSHLQLKASVILSNNLNSAASSTSDSTRFPWESQLKCYFIWVMVSIFIYIACAKNTQRVREVKVRQQEVIIEDWDEMECHSSHPTMDLT